MISDESLQRLRLSIELRSGGFAYCDILDALTELYNYRRTFAKIEHRIVERIERDILGRIGLSGDWQTMPEGARLGICETWRSIIREELERKDSTP